MKTGMFFEPFVNVATEESDTREPIPAVIVVELDDENPVKELNIQKYFTSTPDEKLKYGIEVAEEYAPFIVFDEVFGNITFNARLLPTANDYYVNVFAINQWRNRSLPKLIHVQETMFITPKPLGSAPTSVHLHEKMTVAQIPLTALFKDADIFTYAMTTTPANMPNPGAKLNMTNRVLEVHFKGMTRTYTITITAHMGIRSASVLLHVKEESVFPPITRTDRVLPKTTISLTQNQPMYQINLNDYFTDHPQNALLSVNRGNTVLAYTALTDPPSMQSSVSVIGSMLTVTSRRLSSRFTVNITATNAGGKSVKSSISIQDNL
jgi:hypothetical protein